MKIIFTICWIMAWSLFTGMFWFVIVDKYAFWVVEGMLTAVFLLMWIVIITNAEEEDDKSSGGSVDNLLLTTTTLLLITTIL